MLRARVLLEVAPGQDTTFKQELTSLQAVVNNRVGTELRAVSCHLVLGPFDYLLQFECPELQDVAFVVLDVRTNLGSHVQRTLTLLEHRLLADNAASAGRVPPTPGCLMLVKVIPGRDTDAETAMKGVPGIFYTDVFGPYDYVVEFAVNSMEELATKARDVRSRLSGIAAATMSMATMAV
jgi:DNA-binding Lrp family transcriptional regulator